MDASPGEKDLLRASVLAQRRLRSADERTAAAEAIAAHILSAAFSRVPCVATYLSTATEPGTGPLISGLLDRGTDVIVPVAAADFTLDWVRFTPDATTAVSAIGVPEPTGPRLGAAAIADAGLIVVPALGVDRTGCRLGRGAGYFDRALPHARAPVCALVFADELVDHLPHEPHDVTVDLAVTEVGVFRVPRDAN